MLGIPLGSFRKHRHSLSAEKLITSISISHNVQHLEQLSLSQDKWMRVAGEVKAELAFRVYLVHVNYDITAKLLKNCSESDIWMRETLAAQVIP